MKRKFKNQKELLEFAKKYEDTYLSEVVNDKHNKGKGKGKVGLLIEKYIFNIEANSDKNPDFKDLEVELKSTPLKQNKQNKLVPKERMSLSMLDLEDLIQNENIKDSTKWKKISNILTFWYIHNESLEGTKIEKVEMIEIEKTDFFKQIEDDWKLLRSYALEGRAHEFSESLTKYLGLARKGQKNDKPRIQRLNKEQTYLPRAFTFKIQLLKEMFNDQNEDIKTNILQELRSKYLNKTFGELDNFDNVNHKKKDFLNSVICKDYEVKSFKQLGEKLYDGKKNYTFKTFNYKDTKSGIKTNEHMKFNAILWNDIGKSWEESDFSRIFENPFIFITYEKKDSLKENKITSIEEIVFPENAVYQVIDAYYKYMDAVEENYWENENAPSPKKSSENSITHLRPSAKNAKSSFGFHDGKKYKKMAIWINNKYMINLLGIKSQFKKNDKSNL